MKDRFYNIYAINSVGNSFKWQTALIKPNKVQEVVKRRLTGSPFKKAVVVLEGMEHDRRAKKHRVSIA